MRASLLIIFISLLFSCTKKENEKNAEIISFDARKCGCCGAGLSS